MPGSGTAVAAMPPVLGSNPPKITLSLEKVTSVTGQDVGVQKSAPLDSPRKVFRLKRPAPMNCCSLAPLWKSKTKVVLEMSTA